MRPKQINLWIFEFDVRFEWIQIEQNVAKFCTLKSIHNVFSSVCSAHSILFMFDWFVLFSCSIDSVLFDTCIESSTFHLSTVCVFFGCCCCCCCLYFITFHFHMLTFFFTNVSFYYYHLYFTNKSDWNWFLSSDWIKRTHMTMHTQHCTAQYSWNQRISLLTLEWLHMISGLQKNLIFFSFASWIEDLQ